MPNVCQKNAILHVAISFSLISVVLITKTTIVGPLIPSSLLPVESQKNPPKLKANEKETERTLFARVHF